MNGVIFKIAFEWSVMLIGEQSTPLLLMMMTTWMVLHAHRFFQRLYLHFMADSVGIKWDIANGNFTNISLYSYQMFDHVYTWIYFPSARRCGVNRRGIMVCLVLLYARRVHDTFPVRLSEITHMNSARYDI